MMQYLLLNLCLAAFALAAPLTNGEVHIADNAVGYGTGGGILGLIVLVLDVLVFIEVFKSNRAPSSKILWCLVVFFFPILGMLVYFLFSNREAHKEGGSYEPIP